MLNLFKIILSVNVFVEKSSSKSLKSVSYTRINVVSSGTEQLMPPSFDLLRNEEKNRLHINR